jgi:hypothetical protein
MKPRTATLFFALSLAVIAAVLALLFGFAL